MITLHVGGEQVATWAEAEGLIPELRARGVRVELRDDAGDIVGTIKLNSIPLPNEPLIPWDATITQEEIDRRKAGPFLTSEEFKNRMGWL